MNETSKTIIISVTIICLTALAAFGLHVFTRPKPPASITADKFTHCLQVIMSESRQTGKTVTANEAKDICLNVEGIKTNCNKAS